MRPPSVAEQIGPRAPGVIYLAADGVFEVLEVVTDPDRARLLVGRDCAKFAVVQRDLVRPGAQPYVTGAAWTSDHHLPCG